jgi:outer membrane protein OmpA-like peptidoglycan-associated protein
MPPTFSLAARRALLIPLATVSMAVGLAACNQPPPAAEVVVVVASATSNEPAPALAASDLADLRQAALANGGAVAYVVDTNTGQPTQISLTPRRPDGQVDYGPDRDTVLNENLGQVEQLVGGQAADGPFDLLALLAKAVKVSPVPGTLLVLSSGISTAGGFDLRQVGWSAQPGTVASELKQEGLLPQLAGWHVIFSGLGDTAGDQPALPLPQQTELVAYIMAICHASAAASCSTDDVTRPDPASRSTYPDPVVAVPAVTPVQGPGPGAGPGAGPERWSGESLPADIFFRLNSAALLPGADSFLRPIADRAIAQNSQVSIQGFASPETGTPAYNQALSLARAQAIRSQLIALGVPAGQIVRVVGEGTAGETAAACYRDGHLDEAVCAKLRRVVILLSPVSDNLA